LLGPVERVGQGPAPPAAIKHKIGDVSAWMWTQRSEYESGANWSRWSRDTTTRGSAVLALELFHAAMPEDTLFPHEPYRLTDVIHVRSLSIEASRSSFQTYGYSTGSGNMFVYLRDSSLVHAQRETAAPTAPPPSAPPAVAPTAEPAP